MNILDNVIILSLIIISFISGMKLSDKYHFQAERDKEYALRLQNARIQANDYAVYMSPQPKKRQPLGARFEDKLHSNGRATQQISPDKPIA